MANSSNNNNNNKLSSGKRRYSSDSDFDDDDEYPRRKYLIRDVTTNRTKLTTKISDVDEYALHLMNTRKPQVILFTLLRQMLRMQSAVDPFDFGSNQLNNASFDDDHSSDSEVETLAETTETASSTANTIDDEDHHHHSTKEPLKPKTQTIHDDESEAESTTITIE